MDHLETKTYDVLVVGAGGAGLRAAIEAVDQGVSVAVVCKSLLGKAHPVMSEGGVAAALATTDSRDGWRVHFRDTMRGGKLLNDWRMAQLLAQEAPARVRELEAWGALFDRTPDGRILQRNFGGHQYPRLAHVGDRTGLEMIRTLQDRTVQAQRIDVFMECTVARLLTDDGRISGALTYRRERGRFLLLRAKAVVLATGGIGRAYGGAFLDIASRRTAEDIRQKLPSMYQQFFELADVDITREPMEVFPTTHYMMGGVKVAPESQAATVPGLFAAGEVAGGLHGANRLGGNSLSDLLVFGRRAGAGAATYARAQSGEPRVETRQVDAITAELLAPFERKGSESPYAVQDALQDMMGTCVGIARTADDLQNALAALGELRARAGRVGVDGNRQYNPGWHTTLDLRNLLTVSEAVTRAALARRESRGAHTRVEHPDSDKRFGTVNVVVRRQGDAMTVVEEPIVPVPGELRDILEGKD